MRGNTLFKLHALKAKNGDCLVLEFGKTQPKYILIDGGPYGVFENSIKKFLREKNLDHTKHFEVMILTHVDQDHVIGLLDYLDELNDNDVYSRPPDIKEVWHNYLQYEVDTDGNVEFPKDFTRTRGLDSDSFQQVFEEFWKEFEEFHNSEYSMPENPFPSNFTSRSIGQGDDFRYYVEEKLKKPINKQFKNNDIMVEDHPTVNIEELRIDIIGPSKTILDLLLKKWRKWVKKQVEKKLLPRATRDPRVPNRSSIMFVATYGDEDDKKSILFTGDGRGDYIINGLKERGLLSDDDDDYFFADVLKLPHHGSKYNVTPKFFEKVHATHYVASGDGGQHNNPTTEVLTMIAEASKKQQRDVVIWVTYDNTPEIIEFRDKCPEKKNGYRHEIKTTDPAKTFLTIDLS